MLASYVCGGKFLNKYQLMDLLGGKGYYFVYWLNKTIKHHHSLGGSTCPGYKLLRLFILLYFLWKDKNALAYNQHKG
jgi:hypothetical protein